MQVPSINNTSTYRESVIPPENTSLEPQGGETRQTQEKPALEIRPSANSEQADGTWREPVKGTLRGAVKVPQSDDLPSSPLESEGPEAVNLEPATQKEEATPFTAPAEAKIEEAKPEEPEEASDDPGQDPDQDPDQKQEPATTSNWAQTLPPKALAFAHLTVTEDQQYEDLLEYLHIGRELDVPPQLVAAVPAQARNLHLRRGLEQNPKFQLIAGTSRENAAMIRWLYNNYLKGVPAKDWESNKPALDAINQSLLNRIEGGDEKATKAFFILNPDNSLQQETETREHTGVIGRTRYLKQARSSKKPTKRNLLEKSLGHLTQGVLDNVFKSLLALMSMNDIALHEYLEFNEKKARRPGRGGSAPVKSNTLEHLQKIYTLPNVIPDYIAKEPALQAENKIGNFILDFIRTIPKKHKYTKILSSLAEPRLESLKGEDLENELNSSEKIFQKNKDDFIKNILPSDIPGNLQNIIENINSSKKVIESQKNTNSILKEEYEKNQEKKKNSSN